jgi:hypothetical protein
MLLSSLQFFWEEITFKAKADVFFTRIRGIGYEIF